jgi:uncharacterized protein YicC (UPF0701 family)
LITQVKHSLKQTSSLGRRLDFLMQEIDLSPKSITSDTTQLAVELC